MTNKTYGHSYVELTTALEEAGWVYAARAWRHPNGEAATVEALDDLCRVWPGLTGLALQILLAGGSFNIVIDQSMKSVTVQSIVSIDTARGRTTT